MWFSRLFSRTQLTPQVHPQTGKVIRVYVRRRGLRAKLWFEEGVDEVHIRHHGDDDDFTVVVTPGEPVYVQEAKDALRDLGLDLRSCSWDDIVAKAQS